MSIVNTAITKISQILITRQMTTKYFTTYNRIFQQAPKRRLLANIFETLFPLLVVGPQFALHRFNHTKIILKKAGSQSGRTNLIKTFWYVHVLALLETYTCLPAYSLHCLLICVSLWYTIRNRYYVLLALHYLELACFPGFRNDFAHNKTQNSLPLRLTKTVDIMARFSSSVAVENLNALTS